MENDAKRRHSKEDIQKLHDDYLRPVSAVYDKGAWIVNIVYIPYAFHLLFNFS